MPPLEDHRFTAGGVWRAPAADRWIESDDPARGAPWARFPACDASDVDLAVRAAHEAFAHGPWSRFSPAERGRALHRVADAVVAHADRLGAVETRDNGKRAVDITPGLKTWLADGVRYYAGLADKLEGRVVPAEAADILNYTKRCPYGVAALITAWNSPLLIAIWKLAPALAAGNTVVLKPSEHASISTLALAAALEDADLPPGVVNVVTGYGQEAGAALVRHPLTRVVSFTGGTAGGAAAAALAADRTTPLILELGGKSPQLVFEDADLALAAAGVAAGLFPPAGQSCIAGSRALVHRSLAEPFLERVVEIAARARLGDPNDPDTHIGPIANKPHFDRVTAAIAQGELSGALSDEISGDRSGDRSGARSEARLALDGRGRGPSEGWYVGPTIFADVPPDNPLFREEIFGPVLTVTPFESEEEAVRLANDSDYGLAAGLWTQDAARAIRIADQIDAGTVYINNYFNAAPQSPVGGFKRSGYGRENGVEGLEAFTQTKSVWLATRPHAADPFID